MLKIVVCVSGGGTNLQAIIDGVANSTITNTEIVGVISNNKNAYALERAQAAGIPAVCISPKDYESREIFNDALLEGVKELDPDLIVLAGFLVNIPAQMIKVHEGALARGVRVSGATVHFVDEGTDTGPIILQKAVEVKQDDTPKTLQLRIMEEAEWKILPKAIDLIANGKVEVNDGKVYIK